MVLIHVLISFLASLSDIHLNLLCSPAMLADRWSYEWLQKFRSHHDIYRAKQLADLTASGLEMWPFWVGLEGAARYMLLLIGGSLSPGRFASDKF